MKYSIDFQWKDDEYKDSCIVNGLKELKSNLKIMKEENKHTILAVSKILRNGEYVSYNIKF